MQTLIDTDNQQNWAVGFSGSLLALAVSAWVGIGPVIQLLLFMQGADIVSGMLAAMVDGKLNSAQSRSGLAKKGLEMLLVLVVGFAGERMGAEYGVSLPTGSIIAGFFCTTELVSILENCARGGLNLGPLKAVLEITKKTVNATGPLTPEEQP